MSSSSPSDASHVRAGQRRRVVAGADALEGHASPRQCGDQRLREVGPRRGGSDSSRACAPTEANRGTRPSYERASFAGVVPRRGLGQRALRAGLLHNLVRPRVDDIGCSHVAEKGHRRRHRDPKVLPLSVRPVLPSRLRGLAPPRSPPGLHRGPALPRVGRPSRMGVPCEAQRARLLGRRPRWRRFGGSRVQARASSGDLEGRRALLRSPHGCRNRYRRRFVTSSCSLLLAREQGAPTGGLAR